MKISVLFLILVIISGISLTGINQAFADACTAIASGTWNNPSTWANCATNGIPDNTGDSASVQGPNNIQLNNDFVVGAVSVSEGSSLTLNAKLTATEIGVAPSTSSLFINCNGQLILTTNEGGSNTGLITNHGLVQTLQGGGWNNMGTYLSSGIDIFSGAFNANPNPIVQIPSICMVGGELIPIDTTMVLLGATQTMTSWMIPVIVAGIGIAIVIARKL